MSGGVAEQKLLLLLLLLPQTTLISLQCNASRLHNNWPTFQSLTARRGEFVMKIGDLNHSVDVVSHSDVINPGGIPNYLFITVAGFGNTVRYRVGYF